MKPTTATWTRNAFLLVAAGATILSLSGCTQVTPIPETSPPALDFDAGSRPDYATDMISCLTAKGWPVSVGTDGGYRTGTIPTEQFDLYTSDAESCAAEFGYDELPPALSDEQIRAVFPHSLWEWKCLEDNGYNPDKPPSEQAYIDAYHQTGGLWSAYSQFTGSLSDEDLTALLKACPRSF